MAWRTRVVGGLKTLSTLLAGIAEVIERTREPSAPMPAPVSDSESVDGGPPAHWVERVRPHAPELLTRSRERTRTGMGPAHAVTVAQERPDGLGIPDVPDEPGNAQRPVRARRPRAFVHAPRAPKVRERVTDREAERAFVRAQQRTERASVREPQRTEADAGLDPATPSIARTAGTHAVAPTDALPVSERLSIRSHQARVDPSVGPGEPSAPEVGREANPGPHREPAARHPLRPKLREVERSTSPTLRSPQQALREVTVATAVPGRKPSGEARREPRVGGARLRSESHMDHEPSSHEAHAATIERSPNAGSRDLPEPHPSTPARALRVPDGATTGRSPWEGLMATPVGALPRPPFEADRPWPTLPGSPGAFDEPSTDHAQAQRRRDLVVEQRGGRWNA